MHRSRWLVAVVALVVIVPFVGAQRPDRGGMGGGLAFLLGQKSVQDELKLSEEQVKNVNELQEKQRGAFKGFKNLSKEERRAKFEERAKEQQKAIDGILKPEQSKRLKQIALQQSGSRALNNPEVAAALKLSDDQKAKIKTIQEESFKEMREAFGGGDRAEARKKIEALRKATGEKVQAVLTGEQKTKLNEMMGEPFKGEIKRPEFRRGNRKKS
jgi:hypothetical protein